MKTCPEISTQDLSATEIDALEADRISETDEASGQDKILSLWVSEAQRRLEEYRSGAVEVIPGPEAIASLRRKYGG